MAQTFTQIDNPFGATLLVDDDVDENAQNNKFGPGRLYNITFRNNGGSAAAAHLKLYDDRTAAPGTTDPHLQLPIAADDEDSVPLFEEDDAGNKVAGIPFVNGFSYACVQEAGTPGTTAPADVVEVAFLYAPDAVS